MTECVRSLFPKDLGAPRPVANPGQGNRASAETEQGFENTLDHQHANKKSKSKDQVVQQAPSHRGHVGNSIEMKRVNEQVLSVSEPDSMDTSDQGHDDGNSTETQQVAEQVVSHPENGNINLTCEKQAPEQTSNHRQANQDFIKKSQLTVQAQSDQGNVAENTIETMQAAEKVPAPSYPEKEQGSEETSNHQQANLPSISYNETVKQTLPNQGHTTYIEQEAGQISHQGQATTNSVQAQEEERTILIIGTSRCGKSTIANKMLRKAKFIINSNPSSNLSQTEPFCVREETRNISGIKYNITVIDAVGFDSELFNREDMEKSLRKYNIRQINLIALVIKASRISVSERIELESSLTHFAKSSLQQVSALIFTHCELYEDQTRTSIMEEFIKDDYLGKIAELMRTKIITTGILLDKGFDDVMLNRLEGSIKKDDERIDGLIMGAKIALDVDRIFQPAEEKSQSNSKCHVM